MINIEDNELKSCRIDSDENTNNMVISFPLSASARGTYKPYAYIELDPNQENKFIHIKNFDTQLPHDPDRAEQMTPKYVCNDDQIQNCFDHHRYSKPILDMASMGYHTAQKQHGRCDDIIILNNTVYLIELKNRAFLPHCKIFGQLLSSKKILKEGIYRNHDHKAITNFEHQENTEYKLILCVNNQTIKDISPTYIYNNYLENINSILDIAPYADENDRNIEIRDFECCNENIIIKYSKIINLINL